MNNLDATLEHGLESKDFPATPAKSFPPARDLSAQESSARDFILGRLKDSIVHNPHIPDFEPHYKGAMKLSHELLEEFIINHGNNKSIVVETSREKLSDEINRICAEEGAKKVLYNPDIAADTSVFAGADFIAYTDSIDVRREEFFGVDTSIVQARCGVANIGVLGLSANPHAPRLSSLITNTCIYLLDKNNIVEHMFAGIELIKAYERSGRENGTLRVDANLDSKDSNAALESKSDLSTNVESRKDNILPSNIIFVAGPSRTADIELQTVFGVHGPRKTYLLLY